MQPGLEDAIAKRAAGQAANCGPTKNTPLNFMLTALREGAVPATGPGKRDAVVAANSETA